MNRAAVAPLLQMQWLCLHDGFWPDPISDGCNNPVQDRTRAARGVLIMVNVIKLVIFLVLVSLDPVLGESANSPNSLQAGVKQVMGPLLRSSQGTLANTAVPHKCLRL